MPGCDICRISDVMMVAVKRWRRSGCRLRANSGRRPRKANAAFGRSRTQMRDAGRAARRSAPIGPPHISHISYMPESIFRRAASIAARCSRACAASAATCCRSKATVAPSGSCSSSPPAEPSLALVTIAANSRSSSAIRSSVLVAIGGQPGLCGTRVSHLRRLSFKVTIPSAGETKCPGSSGIVKVMTRSAAKSFPVTVTQLPVTRCEICQRTVAYRPGEASEALTKHYKLLHKDALGEKPREAEED